MKAWRSRKDVYPFIERKLNISGEKKENKIFANLLSLLPINYGKYFSLPPLLAGDVNAH